MKIKVTQEDIDCGATCNQYACPIALAVRRVTGEIGVSVLPGSIGIRGIGVNLPDEAVKFIDRFDEGLHVEPFEFELPLDDGLAKE